MKQHATSRNTAPTQYIRPGALARRWNCSLTTIWRERQRGRLPEPVRLTPGTAAWRLDIIEAIEAERTPQEAA